MLPGDLEKKNSAINLKKGSLNISQGLYDNIKNLAANPPSRL
jgi:hypothetical protein